MALYGFVGKWVTFLFFLIIHVTSAWANPKIDAQTGAYLLSLSKFDYVKSTFDVNFYFWWLSQSPDYAPERSVEITNADQYQIMWTARDEVRDKTRVFVRYSATIRKDWDLTHFPFDRQTLIVSMEDNLLDIDKIDFHPIPHGTKAHPGLSIPGWRILGVQLERKDNVYDTNFGDEAAPNSTYSRINLVIDMKREGGNIFFLYFIGFFLATFLCCTSYFIPLSHFSERNTLSIGSIFSAIGNKYYIDNTLVVTRNISLTDAVTIATFACIMTTIVFNMMIHSFYLKKSIKSVATLNYSMLAILVLSYAITIIFFVAKAIAS